MPPFPTLIKSPDRKPIRLINFVRNMLVIVLIILSVGLTKLLPNIYLYSTAEGCLSTPLVQIVLVGKLLLKKARTRYGLLLFINNPKTIKL